MSGSLRARSTNTAALRTMLSLFPSGISGALYDDLASLPPFNPDWTIGDDQARSMWGKPVAWLNVSPRGASGAHAELRTVLGYAHATIMQEACAFMPVTQAMLGDDGTITDPRTRGRIARMTGDLVGRLSRRSE